ncbi:RNA 2',3'-cyclic phosphodiesterase [Calycomorphotria hydatis]|uniref:2',5' RNA ligase family n=1 Tax=Calycomorphotria hydatis TaxID=2528027 RepID=A0A517TC99_9PLAN|nr:RNA 2',3'-cyclic phosphodiesterase [Calycomorphotria hydatis]QDT65999.1 2',5' RNA ligase family [Calycomorphotria hydatis]
MPASQRTFIGVPISPNHQLLRLLEELGSFGKAVRPVSPGNMHITLKFLGDTPQEVLDKATPEIERAFQSLPACQLDLQGVGYFPDDRRPRVVWVGISPGSVVAEWANIVEEILPPPRLPPRTTPLPPPPHPGLHQVPPTR